MIISCSNLHQICIFITTTFPQAPLCSFHFTSYVFFFSLPPSDPQLLTLGSKLTWAPSAIFSLSLSTSVYVGAGNSRDVPAAHSAHFLSPNMGKKTSSQTPLLKKSFPPLSGMLLIECPCSDPSGASIPPSVWTVETCGGLWVEVEKCE